MSEQPTQHKSDDRLTILQTISDVLNSGLSKESLKICIELVDNGVSGGALAHVIQTIRREAQDDEDKESNDSEESAASTDSTL
ncbi:mitotic-spindle organizing protein 1 [Drosophila sechellia]|uniref:GM14488 n=1 Tax=Drosophila sechellia TaxID=7238 RepID=B4HTC7_DROSE|nr:mitotic-spindle organizing protein 1 [Drosophila sechellia]EDW50198.1 GM14488 [Drosophila sechellia]